MIHLPPQPRQTANDGEIVKDADGEQPAMIQHIREFQANASTQMWNLKDGHATAVFIGERVITALTHTPQESADTPPQRPDRDSNGEDNIQGHQPGKRRRSQPPT